MRNPVAVPTMEDDIVGTKRRRPESVALSRSTAWKKSGMLNMMAFEMMAPIALEMMRPARGFCVTILRGIIGSLTRDST